MRWPGSLWSQRRAADRFLRGAGKTPSVDRFTQVRAKMLADLDGKVATLQAAVDAAEKIAAENKAKAALIRQTQKISVNGYYVMEVDSQPYVSYDHDHARICANLPCPRCGLLNGVPTEHHLMGSCELCPACWATYDEDAIYVINEDVP